MSMSMSRKSLRRPFRTSGLPVWLVLTALCASVSCGGEGERPSDDAEQGTGAGPASGGFTAVGGAPSGGASVGGTAAGGSSVGGAWTGGAASGGAASGGTASGGAASGGAATGGVASGGAATGGAATGGASSGGALATGGMGTGGTPPVLDPDIVVDTATRYQKIDGFGAALPMWVGSASGMLTVDELRKLVGMGDSELGLSIVRTIIEPVDTKWPYAVANLKEAKSYGSSVSILASPWSPPAGMKDNASTTNGGKLLTTQYGAYAAHLNGFVTYMAGQGVTIDVVSVQNEPDWHPDYDSCDWNGTEIMNFVKNNSSVIQAKILAAESLQFTRSLTDPTLNDAAAAGNLDLIGGHLYGAESAGKFTAYPLAEQKGKNRWMTEWLIHEADGSGAAIWGSDNQAVWNETLDQVLRSVHRSMDINWNAYIWWWARRFYSFIGDGEAAYGTTKGQILKRGWAFSHYAKFVRPGYTRVGVVKDAALSSLELTAYDGGDEVVAVILNRSTSSFDDVVFEIQETVTAAKAYVTSRTTNRNAVSVTTAGKYATLDAIPPRSVVTVVMSH